MNIMEPWRKERGRKEKKEGRKEDERKEANCRGTAEQGIHLLAIPPSSKARVEPKATLT